MLKFITHFSQFQAQFTYQIVSQAYRSESRQKTADRGQVAGGWAPTGEIFFFLKFEVKMQGFMHFYYEKLYL